MPQQPFLAFEATAITRHRSISTDDTVAGNNNGNGVAAIGRADGAGEIDIPKRAGNVAIGLGHPAGDFTKLGPNLLFESGAAAVGVKRVDNHDVAREIVADDRRKAEGVFCGLKSNIAKPTPHLPRHTVFRIIKFKQKQNTIPRYKNHIADGRADAVGEEGVHGVRLSNSIRHSKHECSESATSDLEPRCAQTKRGSKSVTPLLLRDRLE
jgi:hypothetical protein